MDTEYIKMVDCPEIQEGHSFEDGDVYSCWAGDLTPNTKGWLSPSIWHKPWAMPVTFLWLPRQAQLQEMVKSTCLDAMYYHVVLLGKVYRAVASMELAPSDSMEQLWLAFVMKELHHKQWDGEKWNGKESEEEKVRA